MALGDVYAIRLRAQFAAGTQTIENLLHYIVTTEGSETSPDSEAAALATAVRALWNTHWKAYTPSLLTLQPVDYFGISDPTIGGSTGAPIVGTGGGTTILPYRTAAVIKKSTGRRGRRYQGRLYLGPFYEADQEAGVLTSGVVANITAYMTPLIAVTTAGNTVCTQVVYSPENLEADPPRPGTIITPITEMQVRSNLGSQRGRQSVN